MALTYPRATYTPLGAQTQNPMVAHDIACLHTMVGYLVSTDRYFRIGNGEGFRGTESHWGMGGIWGPDLKVPGGLDGKIWQWQDMAYRADANYHGSDRVLSMETADNAPANPADLAPWTPVMVESLAQWLAWVCSKAAHAGCPATWTCRREGIPLALIPDTRIGRRGVAYHRQGCPPNIVAGGVAWSTAMGKVCPGDRRIAQIPGIINRARQLATTTPEDTDMAFTDAHVRLLQQTAAGVNLLIAVAERPLEVERRTDLDFAALKADLTAAIEQAADEDAARDARFAPAKLRATILGVLQGVTPVTAEALTDELVARIMGTSSA